MDTTWYGYADTSNLQRVGYDMARTWTNICILYNVYMHNYMYVGMYVCIAGY